MKPCTIEYATWVSAGETKQNTEWRKLVCVIALYGAGRADLQSLVNVKILQLCQCFESLL